MALPNLALAGWVETQRGGGDGSRELGHDPAYENSIESGAASELKALQKVSYLELMASRHGALWAFRNW